MPIVPILLNFLGVSSNRLFAHLSMRPVGSCNRIYKAGFRCKRIYISDAIVDELRHQGTVGLRNGLEILPNGLLKTIVAVRSEGKPDDGERNNQHDQRGKQFL